MPVKAIKPGEPVLGYTLKERIGSGGYGEVWVAEAPGGLGKAIKFIYGYHDENRAQRELKALNRIKEVRHPFLLSLERIDIVDGQMVVITELADMSLKDRFDQCVDSGLKGIPRAELLTYMRDAADALDFISVEHRLQHLDVKPENLLLVSGHVKVADYGLVKDIHDGTQSLMGGLTPAFAPPELFDGRPSKTSDQYSLAIVFQEMLTGQRPFDGATAAQLASQHIKERPQLGALPREDQAIISRALSKDPELRFSTCRALVDELGDRSSRGGTRARKSTPKQKRKSSRVTLSTDATMQLPDGTQPLAMRPAEVTKLPPIDCDPANAKTRPTLFLGIGHTGTYILRQLRRRLRERIGPETATPSIRLLCLDTDRRDLVAACRGDAPDVLADHETFAMPLRRPEEYRADAKMHLAWLSRRWIYNVPRSLQTEGIRPLGRLAFADHHAQLFVRLRQVLSDMVRHEGLADTAETLGMDPLDQPRVYIVGSISGGVCSGMAIDVAYAVRAILKELEVSDDDVMGVFTHSTGRFATDRELTIANALAFLGELYYFSCVSDFPGDETCHLPVFDDERPTLGSTYLVHLGDDLGQKEYEDVTDSVAEYLYLSTATRCASFFDTCRTEEAEGKGLALRTLGVSRSGGVSGDIVTRSAKLLCRHLLDTWLCEHAGHELFDPQAVANKLLADLRLTTEGLVHRVHEVVLANHVNPVEALTKKMSGKFDPAQNAEAQQQGFAQARDAADSFFGLNREDGMTTAIDRVRAAFNKELEAPLCNGILALMDDNHCRLGGAMAVYRVIKEQLQQYQIQVEKLEADAAERMRASHERMQSKESLDNSEEFFQAYAQSRLQQFTLAGVLRLLSAIEPATERAMQELHHAQEQLQAVASTYQADDSVELADADQLHEIGIDSAASSIATQTLDHLKQRLAKLVDRVDQQMQHGVLAGHGGLRQILEGEQIIQLLARPVEDAARATVVEELKEMDLDKFLIGGGNDLRKELVQWLNMNAQPRLLRCGGATRMLLAIPERSRSAAVPKEFQDQLEQAPSVIPSTVGEVAACYEVEQIPLNNVTMSLLQNRPDSIEYASRLHTRTDVPWSPLTAIR